MSDNHDTSPIDDLVAFRHDIERRFAIPPVAFSADGRTVEISGPLTLGLDIGGFGVVERAGHGDQIVIHVRALTLDERIGPRIDFDDQAIETGIGLPGTSVDVRLRGVAGEAAVLGRLRGGRLDPTTTVEPFGEELVRPATRAEVATTIEAVEGSAATIDIGHLREFPDLPARLRSKGFSRHTFMCGQSGSGKTYTTGVLFERLLVGSTLPVIVLDPNSDHVHLGSLADPDDRRPEAERYRAIADEVATVRPRGCGGTNTLCIDFSDLDPRVRAALLQLDPIADLDEYAALGEITDGLTEPYSVADVAAAASADERTAHLTRRIANLGLADWGLWRREGEESAATAHIRGRRFVVVDTGSLSTPSERTVLALAILGNRWRARRERQPMLLAIDEAHNVLPAATDDPLLRSAVEVGALIAGEGRKFGIHLFIASQRPGKVHPNVLSQCDNLVLMRMNGATDVDELESAFSHVPPMLLREALSFGLGQALFAGPLAPLPLIAQVGTRLTAEGGADVPTTWTTPPTVE
jgi:DNA helicase HerA-like ATPase